MAELTLRERLQPSLLDRLTDLAPENRRESLDQQSLSTQQMRQAVLRDLESPEEAIAELRSTFIDAAPPGKDLNDPSSCEPLQKLLQKWQAVNGSSRLIEVHKALLNIFEDGVGAVRVYVRVKYLADKGVPTAKIVADPDSATVTMGKTYGKFYGVFPEEFNNFAVYAGSTKEDSSGNLLMSGPDDKVQGMHSLFSQIQDGYTVVLFGYGLSGSGKSYTLFGSREQNMPGIVQIGLGGMKNVSSLTVASVFELYTNRNTKQDQIQGKEDRCGLCQGYQTHRISSSGLGGQRDDRLQEHGPEYRCHGYKRHKCPGGGDREVSPVASKGEESQGDSPEQRVQQVPLGLHIQDCFQEQ